MDFVKIKNLVRENGDKVIFMENGEPELVVMSFAEYEKLAHLHLTVSLADTVHTEKSKTRTENSDRLARNPMDDMPHETEFVAPLEIAPVRTASIQGDQFGRAERGESARMSDIRLEDLPI